jgi:hypothetical protein
MVTVYSTRTAAKMCEEDRDKILNSGLPIELYTKGIINLGPNNRQALKNMVAVGTVIHDNKLPMFPSRFLEMVVDKTLGESKQDYRITLDGEPGMGKSYTSTYFGARYAMEAAERSGKTPEEFFSLDTCALLQDTDGVTKLMDEAPKYSCVVIDDAGIAAGNRDFLTQSNKNMSAILQTCRTKRWFLIYNMPNRRHVDLQIRELVYSKAHIHLSCHDKGFNVVKLNRERINVADSKGGDTWKHRLSFDNKKVNYFLAFSTDYLEPYVGLIEKYDELRDKATEDLIHERASQESDRKNPTNTRELSWQNKMDEHYETVRSECLLGKKINRTTLAAKTGLNDRDIVKMIAHFNNTEG